MVICQCSWNFAIPRRRQTWKNNTSATDLALNWEEELQKRSVFEVASGEHAVWPQVYDFSKLKIYATSVEDVKCLGHALMSETDGSADQPRELVPEKQKN